MMRKKVQKYIEENPDATRADLFKARDEDWKKMLKKI